MRKKMIWTKEMLDILETMYPDNTLDDIAEKIGCSSTTVGNKARELGLRKSDTYDAHAFVYKYVGRRNLPKT